VLLVNSLDNKLPKQRSGQLAASTGRLMRAASYKPGQTSLIIVNVPKVGLPPSLAGRGAHVVLLLK
jgi:hypothetical protein